MESHNGFFIRTVFEQSVSWATRNMLFRHFIAKNIFWSFKIHSAFTTSRFISGQKWLQSCLTLLWFVKTVSSDSLIKDCSFSCTTHICTVLFYLTGLHSICHVPYASLLYLFFIFLQCPHLYICIVCMYIWLNCIYLYLNVYCQCLMLTVCTKGLRVTQFQFSVCMYCTCGRIDNKADLTWLKLKRP